MQTLDVKKLYKDLDRLRKELDLSWRKLGTKLNIAPCTFTRMKAGRGVNVENYLKVSKAIQK